MSTPYEVYGNYTLLEKLAMGGMAEVFLAKKQGVNGVEKYVAIKRILPQYSQQEEFIEMFQHEASIAINLSHSNIVSIFDFGLEKNQFYIVMDFVPGRNLRQILNHVRKSEITLSTEHSIFIVREIAAGLDYAHRAMDSKTGKPLNIIHRDISPQNVMISFEGEVRIVDFGIAKAESQAEATQAGTLKGKFGYMSPEQVEGLALDLRTDVFSLGILLWELLANDRLFLASNEQATIRKIKECKIPPLRSLNPSVPAELERIVNKALTKDRNLRYQAAAALQKDLTVFLNKYFPMFTNQDFSGFMKKQFNAEILENRKKQMDYSSVKLDRKANLSPPEPTITKSTPPPPRGKTEVTEVTEDSISAVDSFSVGPDGDLTKDEKSTTFKENSRILIPHPTLDKAASTPPMRPTKKKDPINTASLEIDAGFHRTTTTGFANMQVENSFRRKKKKNSSGAGIIYGSAAIGIAALAFVFYSLYQNGTFAKYVPLVARCLSSPANCSRPEEGTTVSSSVKAPELVRIYINSNPPNARIYVQDQPDQSGTKTTPDHVELPANKPAKIIVKMDGFNDWEKTVSGESSETLSADLSKKRNAYLIANIKGTGDLYVNHQKMDHCNVMNPCSVNPDGEVLVEAYDAGTQSYDKVTITLSDGETKPVTLTPKLSKLTPKSAPAVVTK